MRILLSFENFGGTETYTATVANELDRLGHHVMVYSPNRGAMAEFARRYRLANRIAAAGPGARHARRWRLSGDRERPSALYGNAWAASRASAGTN